MSEGPTTTGSIRGKVDLDIAEALAKIEEVKAAAASLGNGRTERIRVDTKDAVRSTDDLEKSNRRLKSSMGEVEGAAKRQNDWQAVALRTLIEIGLAAPPVAAAAVGVTGAMAGMGAAGVFAIAGIARAMKDGTGAGVAYTGMVKGLQGNLHSLQDSATKGLLPGAITTFNTLQAHMPALNGMISQFAGMLGNMAPTGLDAVLTLLERAMPAFKAGGDLLQHMVQSLDDFAHSSGYGDFISYTVQNMPQVETFLRAVIGLVGDLLAAWAPLGENTLPILTNLVTALDDIVKVARPIIPAIGGIYLAFRGWAAITGIVGLVQGALVRLGVTATATAAQVSAATGGGAAAGGGLLSAGVLAPAALALAIPGLIGTGADMVGSATGVTGKAGSSAASARRLMGQTAATGAIGSGVGAVVNSPFRGLMNNSVTGDIMSGTGGMQFADVSTSRNLDNLDKTFASMAKGGNIKQASAMVAQFAAANHLSNAQVQSAFPLFEQQKTALSNLTAAQKQEAAAQQQAAKVQADYKTGLAQLAGEINIANTAAYQSVTSQNAAETALLNTGATLKANKGAWSEHTLAGLADRDAVASAVGAINAHASAINADGKHTAQAKLYTDQHIVALRAAGKAAGVSASDMDGYIAKLLGVPKSVITKITANSVQAEQKAIQAKRYADDYAHGKYQAILHGDFTPAQKAAAKAAQAAKDYMDGHYEAALKADPSLAKSNINQVKKNAEQFGGMKPTASLRARDDTGPAVRSAKGQINSVTGKTVSITSIYTAVYRSTGNPQIAKNAAQFGGPAAGGTIGRDSFPMARFPGLAVGGTGGTISGPGGASADAAGLFRLANGEEVISNLFGQADRWRPLLKAINAGKVDYRTFEKIAAHSAGSRGDTRVINNTPQVTFVNPVAVDPVAQANESAQIIAALGIA